MTNLLQNGNFEGGVTHETRTGETYDNMTYPEGWVGYWKMGEIPRSDVEAVKPECGVISRVAPYLDPLRIHGGEQAWKLFTFFNVHDAGIYQQVSGLEPGQTVRAQAWTHAWSSSDDDPHTSDQEGAARWNFEQYVGIDPTGGTDPYADTVIWSDARNVYDIYEELPPVEVEVGTTGMVTVFLRSNVQYPLKHCDVYWDDATLIVVGEEPPDPGGQRAGKIGPHIIRETPTVEDWISGAPSVALLVGSWNLAQSFPEETLVIGRKVQNQIPGMYADDPLDVARWFVDLQTPVYQEHPDIRYWVGPNEHNPTTPGEMDWIARMEAERMRLMSQMGKRCVIFNFSTGCPPLELWDHAGPALDVLQEYHGLIGLHEYSSPIMQALTEDLVPPGGDPAPGAGWLTLRYRMVHERLQAQGYEGLPIVITECGLDEIKPDQLIDPQATNGAWKVHGDYWRQEYGITDPAAFYAGQLEWYENELQKDDYIVGAVVFCEGHYEGSYFANFDVAETKIVDFLTSLYGDPLPPPPPVSEPDVDYVVVVHLIPQDTTYEEYDEVQAASFGDKQTIAWSAQDAKRLVAPGLPGSKVIVWSPERWKDDIVLYLEEGGVEIVEIQHFVVDRLLVLGAPTTHLPLYVTSPFGVVRTRPDGTSYIHGGVDLRSSWRVWGDEILAAQDGEVKAHAWDGDGYGRYVRLEHGEYQTLYAHLVEGSSSHLSVGDRVKRGDVLGKAGSTGASTGDHLHFGLLLNGYWVDPMPYIDADLQPEPEPGVPLLGVHDRPVYNPPHDAGGDFLRNLNEMRITYLKILEHPDNRQSGFYETLVRGGIIPISRLYVPQLCPDSLYSRVPTFRGVVERCYKILQANPESLASRTLQGRPLIEIWNEPNLKVEWGSGFDPDWHDTDLVHHLAETFVQDARITIAAGGRVGIPAFAPTERGGGTHPKYSSLKWAFGLWDYLMANYKGEIKSWIYHNDLWLASHSCMLAEHDFDHNALLSGDDMSPTGYKIFLNYIVDTIGLQPWVYLTEAGPYSPEHREHITFSRRYDDEGWAAAILAMRDKLQSEGDVEGWCPWMLSNQDVVDPDWHDAGWIRANGQLRAPALALRAENA